MVCDALYNHYIDNVFSWFSFLPTAKYPQNIWFAIFEYCALHIPIFEGFDSSSIAKISCEYLTWYLHEDTLCILDIKILKIIINVL